MSHLFDPLLQESLLGTQEGVYQFGGALISGLRKQGLLAILVNLILPSAFAIILFRIVRQRIQQMRS